MTDLINLMNNLSIKFDESYTIDNDIEIVSKLTYISNITLNFSQLWALFGEIPLIENFRCGLKKYFWIIKGSQDFIFCITGYSEKLLKNEDWIILSNTDDPNANQAFLTHMSETISCYDKYYRSILENEIVHNSNSDAHKIKKELLEVIQILKDI